MSCKFRPEEAVRQQLLAQMLGPLGFPKGLVAVEKKIAFGRRADIIVYLKDGNPLLLVECKAACADEEVAFRQAVGYNATLAAPFWCIAHNHGVRTFWNGGSVPFLPPYSQLLMRVL